MLERQRKGIAAFSGRGETNSGDTNIADRRANSRAPLMLP